VPTEDKVADILAAIKPLLPTPHKITLDLHFAISTTALLNELSIFFLIFVMLVSQVQLLFLLMV
jgi:hypothetical protein